MRRLLVDLLLVLSVLLSAIVAAGAVRSHSVEDRMYHAAWQLNAGGAQQKSYWLMSERGLAGIGVSTMNVPSTSLSDEQHAACASLAVGAPMSSWQTISLHDSAAPIVGSPLNRAGFRFADTTHSTSDGMTLRYQELVLPYWFILLILWAGPVWRIFTAWRLYAGRTGEDEPAGIEPVAVPAV